jgi:hypothetical protein
MPTQPRAKEEERFDDSCFAQEACAAGIRWVADK